MNEWEIPFAETIHRAKKYVVSDTLTEVDWNAGLVQGEFRSGAVALRYRPRRIAA